MQPVIRLTQLFKNSPTLAVGSMIVTLAILTSIFSVYIIPYETTSIHILKRLQKLRTRARCC